MRAGGIPAEGNRCILPHHPLVAALTDVVTVMEGAVVGQAGYSQVFLGAQAVQLTLDDELPFSQAQESLHVVC